MRVQINDDEPGVRRTLRATLEAQGHTCWTATDGQEALEVFAAAQPDVIITDLGMAPMNGLEFIGRLREIDDAVPVIVISADETVSNLRESMRLGANDFIGKPLHSDEVTAAIQRLTSRDSCDPLAQRPSGLPRPGARLVGACEAMNAVDAAIRRAAHAHDAVLIEGEPGTGRTLVTRVLHQLGSRANGPLLTIDCALSGGQLVEDVLFGHERGAFTNATAAQRALFEHADGGAIHLDAVDELPLSAQGRLLELLESGHFRRLGGETPIDADVRVFASTSVDLEAAVSEGRFRDDLRRHLSARSITLPPLRDRSDDAVLLAEHFVDRCATATLRARPMLGDDVRDILGSYRWPGNVRELRGVITRAVQIGDEDTISRNHLPAWILMGPGVTYATQPPAIGTTLSLPYPKARTEFEIEYFTSLLERHQGNISLVARAAGVDAANVRRLLRKHVISADAFRPSTRRRSTNRRRAA